MRYSILLASLSAFAACLIGIGWNSARAQQSVPGTIIEKKGGVIVPPSKGQVPPQQQATPAPATPAASAAVNLDVVGIKLGMPVKDAMLALKADNPRLKLTPGTFNIEGFADPLMPSVNGDEMVLTVAEAVHKPSEHLQILFTMPPSQEVVWGVDRRYTFPTAERPSMQVMVDALRKKYGPESVPPGPPNSIQQLGWIYDAQGKPMGPRGAELSRICESTLNYFGDPVIFHTDIQSPRRWAPQCSSIIKINATVQGIQVAANQWAVDNVEVWLVDGTRYLPALDATRAVMLNAVKAREQKQADEVNKRAAPKF